MAEEQTMCVLCHMEERKEMMVNRMVRRRIPADMWDYFLENPGHMEIRFAFPPDKLQPLISRNRFEALTAIPDKDISDEFLGIISAFVEATKKVMTEPVAIATGLFQAQTTERTTAPSREETEEDKKE